MNTNFHLSFHNVDFDITDIHGQPWLRLVQIGVALGYANPYKVQQVFDRNADEFTDSMTQVIELPTAGGKQQVRVFSLRGCHLLGMLARTKVAKEFRRWVLDVLEETLLNGKISDGIKTVTPKPTRALPDGLTGEQIEAVKKLHNALTKSAPKEAQARIAITLWSAVKSKFGCSYKEVPAEQFPEVLSVMSRVAVENGVPYGEVPDREPLPAPQPALPISGNALADIAAMVYYGTRMIESGKDISAPLKQLGNRQAVTVRTVWHETRPILKRSAAAFEVLRGYADKDTSGRIAGCLEGIYSKAAVR